jgi:AcrR family transcriptional regulator
VIQGSADETLELRERLIDAFTRVASDRGYEQVTIEEITAAAGVSRTMFFDQFDSKRQCLTAAYDAFFERLTVQARDAGRAEETWPASVRAGVGASLEFLSETNSRARLFMVEGIAGGLPLLERRFALMGRLAQLLKGGRKLHPPAGKLPPSTEWFLVGGVFTRVSAHLLAEESGALLALEPEVVEHVLTPYIGAYEARRVAHR